MGGINYDGCASDPNKGTYVCPLKNLGVIDGLFPRDAPVPNWCQTVHPQLDTPYYACSGNFFHPQSGLPCTKPPWSEIVVVNMNKPEVWRKPLGYVPGHDTNWGSIFQSGGAILTKSGLILISATDDSNLWVFDSSNGNKLFNYTFPVQTHHSSPIIYKVNNQPFVVINLITPNERGLVYAFSIKAKPVERSLWWIGFTTVGAVLFIIVLLLAFKEFKQNSYSHLK